MTVVAIEPYVLPLLVRRCAAVSFDVIVVGSGFGGAVSSARLAARGMRVLVIERGPWWGPLNRHRPPEDRREFPRGMWGARKLLRGVRQNRGRRGHEWLLNADGLLQFHRFQHLNVITGSGVGGGSHLYTGIMEAPPPDFFRGYPPEITAVSMQPFLDQVRGMLRPMPAPTPALKTRVFERAVRAAGLPPVESPELAIVWGDDPDRPRDVVNAAGQAQHTSTQRGDVFVGCEDGSKTTLDLTYVPDFAALLWNTRMLDQSSRGPSLGALSRVTRNGVHRLLIAEVGLPVKALPLPRFLAQRLERSTFLFCMGRDASTGETMFDGGGLATAIGRSMDPKLYEEIEGVVTRVAAHYQPTRSFSNFLSGGGPEGLFSVHPLGGCAVGTDPEDGFTDHRGQVFGHPGLFVADGSLYRHAPGIGPSMLIAALAERQATLMD